MNKFLDKKILLPSLLISTLSAFMVLALGVCCGYGSILYCLLPVIFFLAVFLASFILEKANPPHKKWIRAILVSVICIAFLIFFLLN
jgi:asparagine N-glycosylation enzyme membrane subunit Stt3